MRDRVIIWQKWIDPFGDDELPEVLSSLLEDQEPEFYSDTEQEDKQDSHGLSESTINHIKRNIKVISTPMGIIPVTENTASGKIFNFWVGHANFNITKKIADTIEETDGVETLDVFTRYRFRIGVGKAFQDSDVMRNINDKVYENIEQI